MRIRLPGQPVLVALALSVALGGFAGCRGGSDQTQSASSDGTSTSVGAGDGVTSLTTEPVPGGASTTSTKKSAPTSSTIAYFTLPPSTKAPAPDGGSYEPAEAAGRRFVDAVLDGNRASAASFASKQAMDELEPWKPYSRQNDQGVVVPDYRFQGSTKKGTFDATLAPTRFLHCSVDSGKVLTCSFGE